VTCTRPDWARVEGVDHIGVDIAYEGKGLLARCLQHETDHLHGTVFGDRLPQKLRRRLQRDQAEVAADFPDDWPVGRQPASTGGGRV
jgi:peptide deformylase